ncbi:MAG: histidine phosphatase family protein [Methanoregula sp.]
MRSGDYVLDILRNVPREERTIVLVRHSERDSFDGIPEPLREGVEITPRGVSLARTFGESLGGIFIKKRLLLGHTAARRCKMTAESIKEGYFPADNVRILGCQPEIKSPVVDLNNFARLRDKLGWREGIIRWLGQEIPEDTMQNPLFYSDTILTNLLSYPQAGADELLVVVAHDITLFPILFSVFGKNVTAVEFLNGIVISSHADTLKFRYKDATCFLEAERKTC